MNTILKSNCQIFLDTNDKGLVNPNKLIEASEQDIIEKLFQPEIRKFYPFIYNYMAIISEENRVIHIFRLSKNATKEELMKVFNFKDQKLQQLSLNNRPFTKKVFKELVKDKLL